MKENIFEQGSHMFTNFYSNKLFEKVGIQTKFQIKVREELSPVLRTFQRT